jgi:hypothetical protein
MKQASLRIYRGLEDHTVLHRIHRIHQILSLRRKHPALLTTLAFISNLGKAILPETPPVKAK